MHIDKNVLSELVSGNLCYYFPAANSPWFCYAMHCRAIESNASTIAIVFDHTTSKSLLECFVLFIFYIQECNGNV